MNRIPVCGHCLKSGCFVGLSDCECKKSGFDVTLLKTEDELREIGKEKVICRLIAPGETPADWMKIPPVNNGGLFDMCFKELN